MNFNCYIDEAGDEGIDTGGSRWFLIGGVLLKKTDDLAISQSVDRVKELIGQRDKRKALHWRALNRSHNKRLAVIREFGDLPFDFVLCAMDKERLSEKKVFKQKQRLYNYVTRILVERLSWRVRDLTDGKGYADLYFESRSNMSYRALEDYLERVKADPSSQLVADVIGKPKPRTGQERKNLQIVDACIGACFAALEPNGYGMTDQSYVTFLRERFYRREGNLSSYGFKLLPDDAAADFIGKNTWIREL